MRNNLRPASDECANWLIQQYMRIPKRIYFGSYAKFCIEVSCSMKLPELLLYDKECGKPAGPRWAKSGILAVNNVPGRAEI
jgi:hypothetical protein